MPRPPTTQRRSRANSSALYSPATSRLTYLIRVPPYLGARKLGTVPYCAARILHLVNPLVLTDGIAPMVVRAACPRAIPVEHDEGSHAARAARTAGARVRERREVGFLDGRGQHPSVLPRARTQSRRSRGAARRLRQAEFDRQRPLEHQHAD